MKDGIRDWLVSRYPSEKSESPVEAMLAAALAILEKLVVRIPGSLTQQAGVGPYRADFLISTSGADGKERRLVVEVDGHEFHERTKDQAQRDKARDRYMVTNGIEVLRYTGSEVWANPFACAEEVRDRWCVLHYGMTLSVSRTRAHMEAIARMFADDPPPPSPPLTGFYARTARHKTQGVK